MDKVEEKPTPTPEDPQTPQAPEHYPLVLSYNPKIFLIPLIIAVLIILLGVGYLVGGAKLFSPKPPPSASPQITPYPTPTPDLYTESSRSAMANWKTYIHPTRGYKFEYPSDWILSTQHLYNYNTISEKNAIVKLDYYENRKKYTLSIEPFGGRDYFGYTTQSKDVIYDGENFSYRILSKNNVPSLIFVTPYNKDVKFSHIQIQLPPTNTKTYITLFNQILSTFQFTD